jgi:hypothetical protein
MIPIAIVATLVAIVQNLVMLALGAKEGAIAYSPLTFVGPVLLETAFIWVGFFLVGYRRAHRRRLLALWSLVVLAGAQVGLPISLFSTVFEQMRHRRLLRQIRVANVRVDTSLAGSGPRAYIVTYTLVFPSNGRFQTLPAYIGRPGLRTFGEYDTLSHPEYLRHGFGFSGGQHYTFVVRFAPDRSEDLSKDPPTIDICDDPGPRMVCRAIGLRR